MEGMRVVDSLYKRGREGEGKVRRQAGQLSVTGCGEGRATVDATSSSIFRTRAESGRLPSALMSMHLGKRERDPSSGGPTLCCCDCGLEECREKGWSRERVRFGTRSQCTAWLCQLARSPLGGRASLLRAQFWKGERTRTRRRQRLLDAGSAPRRLRSRGTQFLARHGIRRGGGSDSSSSHVKESAPSNPFVVLTAEPLSVASLFVRARAALGEGSRTAVPADANNSIGGRLFGERVRFEKAVVSPVTPAVVKSRCLINTPGKHSAE